jgi:hypothetical protein
MQFLVGKLFCQEFLVQKNAELLFDVIITFPAIFITPTSFGFL